VHSTRRFGAETLRAANLPDGYSDQIAKSLLSSGPDSASLPYAEAFAFVFINIVESDL
jgi:hypothetical protein